MIYCYSEIKFSYCEITFWSPKCYFTIIRPPLTIIRLTLIGTVHRQIFYDIMYRMSWLLFSFFSWQKNELQVALLERKRLNRELLSHILKAVQYEKVRDGQALAELIRSMAAHYMALLRTCAWRALLCISSAVLILLCPCLVNISTLFVLTRFISMKPDGVLYAFIIMVWNWPPWCDKHVHMQIEDHQKVKD